MGEVINFEAKEQESLNRKIEITETCKELYLAYWHLASLVSPERMAVEMSNIRGRPIKLLTREDYERALENKPWAS